jgi:phosphoribosylformylglycinamidine synthase
VPGLGGSAYAELAGAAVEERLPTLDLGRERALQRLLLVAANEGILASAQDVSGGGLAVALAECAIWGGVGASLTLQVSAEPAVELFGESPSRAVVTVRPPELGRLEALAAELGVTLARLGEIGGERLHVELVGGGAAGAAEERGASVADALDCTVAELRHAWEQALPRALGEVAFAPPAVPEAALVPDPSGEGES